MAINLGSVYQDPLAQTFISPSLTGVYITKIGLFFHSKSTAYPVSIDIRPGEAFTTTGRIKNISLPGSEVSLNASQVTADTTGQTETIFEFDEPVYLAPGEDYAVAVKSIAGQDYKLWASAVGDYPINSSGQFVTARKVTKQYIEGSLFRSAQGTGYIREPNSDLKIKIYRAKFNYSSATVAFKDANPPKRKLIENPLTTTSGSGTITVYQPNHGFQVNDKVLIEGLVAATSYNGILGSNINGTRTITAVDGTGYQFVAGNSDTASASGRTGSTLVSATQQYIFNTSQLNVNGINQKNFTQIKYNGSFCTSQSLAGSETAYATTSSVELIPNADVHLSAPHVILSDSNETTHYSGNESTTITGEMINLTSNNFTSPLIDLQQANLILNGNILDKNDSAATVGFNVPLNWVDETDPVAGSALAKHITKMVTLENPANGLKILFAGYRPVGAEFKVYYRTLAPGSDENIRAQNWIAAEIDQEPPVDTGYDIFRNYEVNLGGEFYNSLDEFNRYQVKIVFRGTNSANPPKIRDLRTIAYASIV